MIGTSWHAPGPRLGHGGGAVRLPGGATRLGDVTIVMVMQEALPLAEIKAHLSEIVDRVEREHDRAVLTRNGRAAAVIMSPGDLEALEGTLELLSDPATLEEIGRARQDVAQGKVVTAGRQTFSSRSSIAPPCGASRLEQSVWQTFS
jgi:antitoxin YefM